MISFLTLVLFLEASLTVSFGPKDGVSTAPPSDGASNSSSWAEQKDAVEAVKRHILHMLCLNAPPNLTKPVPRTALLNAIRAAHLGHVTEEGAVEMEEGGGATGESADHQAEVIRFAEAGGAADVVTFDLWQHGAAALVERANVWIFMKASGGERVKGKVKVRLLGQRPGDGGEEPVSKKMVDVHHSGWHAFSVTRRVQALLDAGRRTMRLQVSCPLCTQMGASPVLTPEVGASPVLTPEVGASPVLTPETGASPVLTPEVGASPVLTPETGALPVLTPEVGASPVLTPETGALPVLTPEVGASPVLTPETGALPVLTPEVGASPVLTPKTGASPVLTLDAGASPILKPGPDPSHRPFLMMTLQAQEAEPHGRMRRGLDCDGEMRVCCRRHLYVDFKVIGWSDWIIAPSGYHANYCEGECSAHMADLGLSPVTARSAVVGHYRLRSLGPSVDVRSCCVATRLRAVSMLFYDHQQKIVKKDVENMMVDECGCS